MKQILNDSWVIYHAVSTGNDNVNEASGIICMSTATGKEGGGSVHFAKENDGTPNVVNMCLLLTVPDNKVRYV